jgi:hypothetical protein
MPPYTFITDARVRSHIAPKVGESYAQLVDRLQVSQEMTLVDGFLVGQGCAAHKCGTDEAFIALDTRTGAFLATAADSGVLTVISAADLPPGVGALYGNWAESFQPN